MAEILEALGHPSRIKILQVLEKDERSVGGFEKIVKIQQSNLSQHLRILEDRGILECQRTGMEVYYRIKDEEGIDIIRCGGRFSAQGGQCNG